MGMETERSCVVVICKRVVVPRGPLGECVQIVTMNSRREGFRVSLDDVCLCSDAHSTCPTRLRKWKLKIKRVLSSGRQM